MQSYWWVNRGVCGCFMLLSHSSLGSWGACNRMITLRPKANCKGCSYVCFPCPKGTWRMKRVWKGLKVCAMLYKLQLSLLEGWQEPVGEKQIQELRWVKICCLSRGKWEGVCSDEGSELGVFSLSHPHHSADPSQLFQVLLWCDCISTWGHGRPPSGQETSPGLSYTTAHEQHVCVSSRV